MVYLHSRDPPVLHRDLKSGNLLIDADGHLKISDFGLARPRNRTMVDTQVGTWGWMSPEVLNSEPYDEKADVYAFGVVLWELITGQEPFAGLNPLQVMKQVDAGERPPFPPGVPSPYRWLVEDCWQKNPAFRPAFDKILLRLQHMGGLRFGLRRWR